MDDDVRASITKKKERITLYNKESDDNFIIIVKIESNRIICS